MHRGVFMVIGLLAFGGLGGCAAVLTAGSMATSAGINHTLKGIAYKTFVTPVDDLRTATLATLDKMDMSVTDIKEVKAGWEIKAKAYDRIIEIELEALTRRSTRMRVVANQGKFFFKDAATATEIINQTAETLDRTAAKTQEGQKQSRRADRPPHTHPKPPHTHQNPPNRVPSGPT